MKQLIERKFDVHRKLEFKSIDEVVSFLQRKGIELQEVDYIGRGAFGQAFLNPKSGQVIKITTDQQEIDFYKQVQEKNLNDKLKHLVKIHKVFDLNGTTIKGIILMEKLEPLPRSVEQMVNRIIPEIAEFPSDVSADPELDWGEIRKIFHEHIKPDYTKHGNDGRQTLLELIHGLKEIKQKFDEKIFNAIIYMISFASSHTRYIFESFVGLYVEEKKFMTDYFNMILEFEEHDLFHADIKPAHILYSKEDDIYKVIDPRVPTEQSDSIL